MRATLRLLPLCVVVVSAFMAALWWRHRSPSSYGSVRDHVFQPPGRIETAVPAFTYGAFDFNDNPPAIAYFVHITDPRDLASPMPWLKTNDGRVFVDGDRILPRPGVVQIFVADGKENPRSVVLSDADRRVFYEFLNSPAGFDECARFWNDVLQSNHLPDLERESSFGWRTPTDSRSENTQ